jgi:hypothetical protein
VEDGKAEAFIALQAHGHIIASEIGAFQVPGFLKVKNNGVANLRQWCSIAQTPRAGLTALHPCSALS